MDWLGLLDAIGEDRRFVIQAGPIPGTAEVWVEEKNPSGYRCTRIVTREAIGSAAVDVIGHAVVVCNRAVVGARR